MDFFVRALGTALGMFFVLMTVVAIVAAEGWALQYAVNLTLDAFGDKHVMSFVQGFGVMAVIAVLTGQIRTVIQSSLKAGFSE